MKRDLQLQWGWYAFGTKQTHREPRVLYTKITPSSRLMPSQTMNLSGPLLYPPVLLQPPHKAVSPFRKDSPSLGFSIQKPMYTNVTISQLFFSFAYLAERCWGWWKRQTLQAARHKRRQAVAEPLPSFPTNQNIGNPGFDELTKRRDGN